MSRAEAHALAVEISRVRKARGFSVRGLADAAGVNQSTLTMLQRGQILAPQPDTLMLLARALRIRVSDLFAIAGWLPASELPELGPYLRGKYRELDDDQISEVERYVAQVRSTCPRAQQAGQ